MLQPHRNTRKTFDTSGDSHFLTVSGSVIAIGQWRDKLFCHWVFVTIAFLMPVGSGATFKGYAMSTEPSQLQQEPAQPSAKGRKSLVVILAIIALVLLLILGVYFMILLPAARVLQTQNNARQVAIAALNLESATMRLPSNETDDEGNDLFSWRKRLLPFLPFSDSLGRGPYSDAFGRGTSWDDPANKQVTDTYIEFFKSARGSSHPANVTHFVAVNDPRGPLYKGRASCNSIQNGDGLANTAMFLEHVNSDITWAEPRDISMDEAISIIQGCNDSNGTVVAMCDASVITVLPDASAEDIKKLFLLGNGAPENLPIAR